MLKLFFLGFILFAVSTIYSQNTDTIKVLVTGDFKKKESFVLMSNNKVILQLGYKNNCDSTSFIHRTVVDTLEYENDLEFLDLVIYRNSFRTLKPEKYFFIYDSERKYIHIYHFLDKKSLFKIESNFQMMYRKNSEILIYND